MKKTLLFLVFYLWGFHLIEASPQSFSEGPLQGKIFFSRERMREGLQARSKNRKKVVELKIGKSYDVEIEFWPLSPLKKVDFRKLEGTKILDAFYVAAVRSIEASSNNADVLVIRAKIIMIKNFSPHLLPLLDLTSSLQGIPMSLRGAEVNPKDKVLGEKFLFLQKPPSQSWKTKKNFVIGLVFLGVTISLMPLGKRLRTKSLRKRALKLKRKQKEWWAQKFQEAKDRPSIEETYAQRKDWLPLLEEGPSLQRFLKLINEKQYQRTWSLLDLGEMTLLLKELVQELLLKEEKK